VFVQRPVLELPGDMGISTHCGCGPPCNTRRRSLGAFGASVSSLHCFLLSSTTASSVCMGAIVGGGRLAVVYWYCTVPGRSSSEWWTALSDAGASTVTALVVGAGLRRLTAGQGCNERPSTSARTSRRPVPRTRRPHVGLDLSNVTSLSALSDIHRATVGHTQHRSLAACYRMNRLSGHNVSRRQICCQFANLREALSSYRRHVHDLLMRMPLHGSELYQRPDKV